MNPPAKLSDLTEPLDFQSEEYCSFYDRQTGRIVSVDRTILNAVEGGDDEELTDLPDWQKGEVETALAIVSDGGNRFSHPPDPFDFHEYRHMEDFIASLPDGAAANQLWRAIRGRGVFRRFKDTLHRLGIQDEWFRYRDEAMREFVIKWAEANNVPLQDDCQGGGY